MDFKSLVYLIESDTDAQRRVSAIRGIVEWIGTYYRKMLDPEDRETSRGGWRRMWIEWLTNNVHETDISERELYDEVYKSICREDRFALVRDNILRALDSLSPKIAEQYKAKERSKKENPEDQHLYDL